MPSTLATIAPMPRKAVLASGVASPLTLMWIPPDTTKSEPMSAMKLKYSIPVCHTRS